jgi:hypothetical protein
MLSVSGLYNTDRMINEYVEVDGVKTGKENWGVERKPTPMPLRPPQIPDNLTLDQSKLATNCLICGTVDVIVTEIMHYKKLYLKWYPIKL